MEFLFLVGLAVVAVVVTSAIFVRSRPDRGDPDGHPRVVTQNLDYTILGQRPEIVTEDDPETTASP